MRVCANAWVENHTPCPRTPYSPLHTQINAHVRARTHTDPLADERLPAFDCCIHLRCCACLARSVSCLYGLSLGQLRFYSLPMPVTLIACTIGSLNRPLHSR